MLWTLLAAFLAIIAFPLIARMLFWLVTAALLVTFAGLAAHLITSAFH